MPIDITLRGTKGSPLTNAELDANFSNLKAAAEAAAAGLTVVFSALASYQALAGQFVVMTSPTACTVRAPLAPADSAEFGFWFTNGLDTNEIGWDGSRSIDGAADDVRVDVGFKVAHKLRYLNSTHHWRHFV